MATGSVSGELWVKRLGFAPEEIGQHRRQPQVGVDDHLAAVAGIVAAGEGRDRRAGRQRGAERPRAPVGAVVGHRGVQADLSWRSGPCRSTEHRDIGLSEAPALGVDQHEVPVPCQHRRRRPRRPQVAGRHQTPVVIRPQHRRVHPHHCRPGRRPQLGGGGEPGQRTDGRGVRLRQRRDHRPLRPCGHTPAQHRGHPHPTHVAPHPQGTAKAIRLGTCWCSQPWTTASLAVGAVLRQRRRTVCTAPRRRAGSRPRPRCHGPRRCMVQGARGGHGQ